mmetsp:Transcript_27708/g.49252  ORF Transcript_27708/g.49252 Transcript_27708/m.49252 type:complete len:237 (-) Transcript_27708:288-998(-)
MLYDIDHGHLMTDRVTRRKWNTVVLVDKGNACRGDAAVNKGKRRIDRRTAVGKATELVASHALVLVQEHVHQAGHASAQGMTRHNQFVPRVLVKKTNHAISYTLPKIFRHHGNSHVSFPTQKFFSVTGEITELVSVGTSYCENDFLVSVIHCYKMTQFVWSISIVHGNDLYVVNGNASIFTDTSLGQATPSQINGLIQIKICRYNPIVTIGRHCKLDVSTSLLDRERSMDVVFDSL